ncbi:MAG TPA: Clp1/GlmU family protein [Sulfolobales archaeon]|nr:Clp1/GlmU family protein [Sulfolobales archaeon]
MVAGLRISVEISENRSIRIRGPARISVIDGECYISGAKLLKGSQIIVSAYKSQAIYSRSRARVEIELGEGAGVDVAKPEEEPLFEWLEAAYKLAAKGSRVVVIGPTESGKTSFSVLLANIAIEQGLRPCIVDGDVGQEDIGPPGFVALSCPSKQFVWLRDLEPQAMRFIGHNNPLMGSYRLVASIADLVSKASNQGDLIVINTDGWVSSPQAIEMKLDIARYVEASHIVALAGGSFMGHLPRKGFAEIVVLRSPQGVRVRSREERRVLRSQAYKKAFEGSVQRSFSIGEVIITGSCLFSGNPVSGEELSQLSEALSVKVLYASILENTIYALTEGGRESDKPLRLRDGREVVVIPKGSEKGLLCSLVSRTREEFPCIVDSIDTESLRINVVTRYQGDVSAIIIGRIKLDESYEDSWRGSRCQI